MRHRTVILATALALLVCGAAQASVIVTLINNPVSDGLFTEDGVMGYQYIWDVTTSGGAPASLSFLGFDGSQAAWVRTHPFYQTTGAWQKWGNPAGGSNTGGFTGDDVAAPSTDDGGGWRLSLDTWGDFGAAGSPYPWSMINTWHVPGDYASGAAAFMPTTDGLVLTSGLKWSGVWNSFDLAHSSGLMLTIRLVHAGQPEPMGWEASGGDSGTTTGPTGPPIPEPATMLILGCGIPILLRVRRRLRA